MNSIIRTSVASPMLFTPYQLAGHQLRNRVCFTATLSNFGTDSRVTPAWQHFLVERARGGTGMLVTEGIAVDPNALAHPAVVAGFDPGNEDGFRETANGVHGAGGVLLAQLWHAGRQQLWAPTRSPQGVSDQPDAYSWSVPHVMDEREIRRVIQSFVDVAQRFHRCGFDGVELHGAHGYLITQFMSPWSNTRTDGWGGARANRLRFVTDIAQQIRATCGDAFIIGLKLPGDEGVRGGIDPTESMHITAALTALGVFDYFAYSQGNFSRSLENHVPDHHFNEGHFLNITKRVRDAAAGTAVMALGRIGSVEFAERALTDGVGDLIGMSRALISDAAWANKAQRRRSEDIRPCVFDNYPWGVIHTGKPIAEFHNPMLGKAGEADWEPTPAARTKRVAVVGAGPCGLEAAWIAAARGHDVTLFSQSTEAGGSLRLQSQLPGFGATTKIVDYQLRLCQRYDVRLLLGQGADVHTVEDFDDVLVCAGSTMRAPQVDGLNDHPSMSVRQFARHINDTDAVHGRTAVLLDMDHTAPTYAVAIALAERFDQVVIVTPRTHIAQNVDYCSALGVYRRLYHANVKIEVATDVMGRAAGGVVIENVFNRVQATIDKADWLFYATPRRANTALLNQHDARIRGRIHGRIHGLGDCVSPRNLMIALHEAHAVSTAL